MSKVERVKRPWRLKTLKTREIIVNGIAHDKQASAEWVECLGEIRVVQMNPTALKKVGSHNSSDPKAKKRLRGSIGMPLNWAGSTGSQEND